MTNLPKYEKASLRAFAMGALIYSVAIAVFYCFVPGDWEGSAPIKAVFGDDLLTPALLYYLLVFSAPAGRYFDRTHAAHGCKDEEKAEPHHRRDRRSYRTLTRRRHRLQLHRAAIAHSP
jgi:hypothetical protein